MYSYTHNNCNLVYEYMYIMYTIRYAHCKFLFSEMYIVHGKVNSFKLGIIVIKFCNYS